MSLCKKYQKRRTLYLTLIKSLFNASETFIEPFENFQKRCVKWIHKESYTVYRKSECLSKLKSIDIFPMESHFVKHDLILFFKIIHLLVPVKLPIEIVPCISRTRASRDDAPTFKVHDEIGAVKRVFSNSFLSEASHNGIDYQVI